MVNEPGTFFGGMCMKSKLALILGLSSTVWGCGTNLDFDKSDLNGAWKTDCMNQSSYYYAPGAPFSAGGNTSRREIYTFEEHQVVRTLYFRHPLRKPSRSHRDPRHLRYSGELHCDECRRRTKAKNASSLRFECHCHCFERKGRRAQESTL